MADGKSTYDIEIKTAADLKAAEAYKRSLEAAKKAAQDMGKDLTELNARSTAVDKALTSNAARAIKLGEALKQAQSSAKSLHSDTAGLDSAIKAAGGSLEEHTSLWGKLSQAWATARLTYGEGGGGLAGAFKVLTTLTIGQTVELAALAGAFLKAKEAVEAYAESEDKLNAMQVALASQGKYSRELAESIADMAGTFEKATNIGDDHWLTALTKLIQYGAPVDNIKEIGNTLKNLAGIIGGDVETAGSMLIRALNGNYKGFKNIGIEIDKNASAMENWKRIVDQTARGADALEKRTQTLTGAKKGLSVALGNVSKGLGQAIAEGLNFKGILQLAADATNKFADKLGFTVPHIDGLSNAVSATARSMDDLAESTEQQEKRFKKMADEAERAAREVENVKRAVQSFKSAEDEVASAQQDFELALVDDEEKRTGNRLGAARKRAQIKSRFARQKKARQDEADIAEVAANDKLATQLRGQRKSIYGTEASIQRSISGASALEPLFVEKSKADDEVRALKEQLQQFQASQRGIAAATGGGMSVGSIGNLSPTALLQKIAVAEAAAAAAGQRAYAAQGQTKFQFNTAQDVSSYLKTKGGELETAAKSREEFDKTGGRALEQLDIDRPQLLYQFQRRNAAFAFQQGAAAIQANTGERDIRTELANQALQNLQGGKGAGVFQELKDTSQYIPQAIMTAAGVSKLLRELVNVYGLTAQQVQDIQKEVADLNKRAQADRWKKP